MNGLSHKQARRYMAADLDGLLSGAQRLDLETHLAGCEACRAEAQSLSTLMSHLQSEFHERRDTHDGPSHHVTENVRSQSRRIAMSNKVKFGLKVLGGVALLVVLGFAVNYVISHMQKWSIAASPTTELADLMPVVAPNAEKRLLAFTMEKNGEIDVYTVRADGSNLTNLTGASNGNNPYWSPNGKRIAFARNIGNTSQVFVMDADGSNVIQLTEDGELNRLVSFEEGRESGFDAWSPNGSKLVFVKLDFNQASSGGFMRLYVLDVETKTQTPLTSEWGIYQSPAWSPDGEHIAFSSFTYLDEQGEPTRLSVHVVGADGSNSVDLTASLGDDVFSYFHRWSGDGQTVLFSVFRSSDESSQVYKAGLDGSLVELSQPSQAILRDWWNGTALTSNFEEQELRWLRSDGSSSSLEGCPQAGNNFKVASTRSKAGILFLGVRCDSGEWHLYLANEDGTAVQELVDPPLSIGDGIMVDQAWSPDDNYIAFNISIRSENTVKMFILDVVGTLNDPTLEPVRFDVGAIFSSVDSLSWQPVITEKIVEEQSTPTSTYNGLIAFTSAAEDGNTEIYTIRADGSGFTNLTNDPAHDVNPFWSPDGKRIAFLSDRAGYMQVFTMNADGSDVFQVTYREADHEFSSLNPWSPDGSTLLFLEKTPDGKQILYSMQANGRNGVPRVSQPDNYSNVSWSPDGRDIAYIILEPVGNRDMARIHMIDANGNDDTNITAILPEDEDLSSWNYTWTREGNIRFVAARVYAENGNTKSAAYKVSLDGNTLVELAKTSTPLEDWWRGTTFVRGFTGETLTWLRPDGTFSELKPYENFQMGSQPGYFGISKRSSTGYLLYTAGCPNGDLWLYWANPDGTDVRQLLASTIKITDGGLNDINWSPDGGQVTLTVNSSGITYLNILDVRDALKSPLTQFVSIPVGGGGINYNVSWQPTP